MLPESDTDNISLDVCFKSNEVMNRSVFDTIKQRYADTYRSLAKNVSEERFLDDIVIADNFTIGEHFDITISSEKLLMSAPETQEMNITIFLIVCHTCYHIEDVVDKMPYIMNQEYLKNVTYAVIATSLKKLNINRNRFQKFTEVNDMKRPKTISIKSISYEIQKLPWPHTDNCINFTKIGYADKFNAIASCINEKGMSLNGRIYRGITVTRLYEEWMGKRLSFGFETAESEKIRNTCVKNLSSFDNCYQKIIFSDLVNEDSPDSYEMNGKLTLLPEQGNSPSYMIESKPRIDHIDYITYILGALGSWLGFSFLSINPIPYILKMKEEQESLTKSARNGFSDHSFLRFKHKLNERLLRHRLLLSRMDDDLSYQKFKINRIENILSLSHDTVAI